MNDTHDHESWQDDADLVATGARLRRTLDAVTESTPTVDRSEQLLAALDTRSAQPTPHLDSGSDSGPPSDNGTRIDLDDDDDGRQVIAIDGGRPHRLGRRLLAAAAAVVVIALIGLAVAQRGGGDGEGQDVDVVDTPDAALDTGWYLPASGWEITAVGTDFLDVEGCPCTYWAAARPGDDPAAISVEERTGDLEPPTFGDPEPVDVGGRPGLLVAEPFATVPEAMATFLTVILEDRILIVSGHRDDRSRMVVLADAWLDQRDASGDIDADSLPLPPGFEGTPVHQKGGWRSEHVVVVAAREKATGREVVYQLSPTGWNRWWLLSPSSLSLDDAVIRTFTSQDAADQSGQDGPVVTMIGGPADIVVGDAAFMGPVEPLTDEQLSDFVDGLHEVSTADWRAALEGVDDVDAKVHRAPTLFDAPLVDGE